MFMWKIKSWWPLSSNQQTTISMETLRGCLSTSRHTGKIVTPPVRLTHTQCCASFSPKLPRTRMSQQQHVTGHTQVFHSTSAPLQLMGNQLKGQMSQLKKWLISGNMYIAATYPRCIQTPTQNIPMYAIHIYTRYTPLLYRKTPSFYVATYWHWIHFQLNLK